MIRLCQRKITLFLVYETDKRTLLPGLQFCQAYSNSQSCVLTNQISRRWTKQSQYHLIIEIRY